ncbi:hypothetical protein N1027_14150 [Herbiconiux sp. CPCC 205763]|uniref:Nucleotide exchange factor GrpE n=1 Tax=Herbiconiux aconitum TaxID=2970913 RepID=A0ABT2GSS9_9MICO|nr:hypothetical protein [Herbiconiux aconitum]MCS5719276.1 hypothetical protein [Herbiconiux aconitum]
MSDQSDSTKPGTDPDELPDGAGNDAESSQQKNHDAETQEDTASGGPAD